MDLDADKLLENALRDGIREAVKAKLTSSYSDNPLGKIINVSIERHAGLFQSILGDSIKACLEDDKFRADIAASVRSVLAKTLVQRFGGELEKQVNVLKSDPATRARITLAIEEIVKSKVVA